MSAQKIVYNSYCNMTEQLMPVHSDWFTFLTVSAQLSDKLKWFPPKSMFFIEIWPDINSTQFIFYYESLSHV